MFNSSIYMTCIVWRTSGSVVVVTMTTRLEARLEACQEPENEDVVSGILATIFEELRNSVTTSDEHLVQLRLPF